MMIHRQNRVTRRFLTDSDWVGVSPTINRLQTIASELEEIKKLVSQIESKAHNQINREELNEIEKRLNVLEYELFYDSLN
jgi:hypothetical protein